MNAMRTFCMSGLLGAATLLGACDDAQTPAADETGKTGFPGQITAGGGTSGEVMAAAGQVKDTADPSGTPGIPQGSEGNVGGAALGGTTAAAQGDAGKPGGAATGQPPSQTGNPKPETGSAPAK